MLFAQHRFDEALAAAHRAHDLNPRLGALALVGDVLLATGDYEGAALTYSEIAATTSSPGLTARIAHLNELSGRPQDAITQMEEAARDPSATGRRGEEAAWFQVRLGDLNFSIGNLDEADHRYRAALELFPRYWSALAGNAKVSAARGDFDRAIDFYESAAAVLPRPEIMMALGDVYSAAGKTAEATDSYATVEVIAQLADGAYNRALVLYFAEHGRPDEAVIWPRRGSQPEKTSIRTTLWRGRSTTKDVRKKRGKRWIRQCFSGRRTPSCCFTLAPSPSRSETKKPRPKTQCGAQLNPRSPHLWAASTKAVGRNRARGERLNAIRHHKNEKRRLGAELARGVPTDEFARQRYKRGPWY